MVFVDRESNNSRGEANFLGEIPRQGTFEGRMDDVVDTYRIRVNQPSNVATALFPKTSNLNFHLLDINGNLLRSSTQPSTITETISVSGLQAGDYFLQVANASPGTTTDYSFTLSSAPLISSQASVTVFSINGDSRDQFDSSGPFVEPDFFTKVTINGVSKTSRTIQDDRTATSLNFTASQSFDPTSSRSVEIPIKIEVFDADTFGNQRVDINPTQGVFDLNLILDTRTGFLRGDGIGFRRAGEFILVNGNGDNDNADVTFKVDLGGFTSTSANRLQSLSTKIGKNSSETIVGKKLSGILDGRGGHDDLSGMGGHDVLIGGTGNDKMNGGIGRDLLWGGLGRDIHHGGSSRDTFVLDADESVDVLKDYKDGTDKLGLYGGLSYEILDIVQEGKNIGIYAPNDKLAVLQNTRLDQITAADFMQVDFAEIKGITTPYAIG